MMKKKFSKFSKVSKGVSILVVSLGWLVFTIVPSFAIPSLQLYIPGSTYDFAIKLWTTYDTNFELQVMSVASPANVDHITNLKLYVAIPKNEKGLCGAYVNINGSPLSFNKYGIPLLMPHHSIFPTYYSAFSLPDLMVSTAGKTNRLRKTLEFN